MKKYIGHQDKYGEEIYDGDLVLVDGINEPYMVCLAYSREILLVNGNETIEMYKVSDLEIQKI